MLIQCYLLIGETINPLLLLFHQTKLILLLNLKWESFLPWQQMVEELLMRPQHKGTDFPMSENGSTISHYFQIQLGIKWTNFLKNYTKRYITMLSKSVKGISSREHEPCESSTMPRYDFPFCLHSGTINWYQNRYISEWLKVFEFWSGWYYL